MRQADCSSAGNDSVAISLKEDARAGSEGRNRIQNNGIE